jgi:hypothetical protein
MPNVRCLAVLVVAMAGCSMSHDTDDDAGRVTPGIDGGSAPVDAPRPRDDARDAAMPDVRLRDAGALGDGLGDVWEGYIESQRFPSGSDRVRIVFDSATEDGPRTGTVTFGEGPGLPPLTDPAVGYPTGADPRESRIVEGHPYRIVEGSVVGDRVVVVSADTNSIRDVWCQLQTPYLQIEGSDLYGCMPAWSGSGERRGTCFYIDRETEERVTADCGWIALCSGLVCQCDASGCVATPGASPRFDFDVTGDEGDGSVTNVGGSLNNIHLTRE